MVLPTASMIPSVKSQGLKGALPRKVPMSLQVTAAPRERGLAEETGNQALCLSQENSCHLPSRPTAGAGWLNTHTFRTSPATYVSVSNSIMKTRVWEDEKTIGIFHECVVYCEWERREVITAQQQLQKTRIRREMSK